MLLHHDGAYLEHSIINLSSFTGPGCPADGGPGPEACSGAAVASVGDRPRSPLLRLATAAVASDGDGPGSTPSRKSPPGEPLSPFVRQHSS